MRIFIGLRSVTDARCFTHFGFAPRYTQLRGFGAKNRCEIHSTLPWLISRRVGQAVQFVARAPPRARVEWFIARILSAYIA